MRILCLGDSIMQYNDCMTYPQTGWVQELPRFFRRGTEFLNFARNGRSTKSFIAEGRFDRVLSEARAGDFALIGFAHNDEKSNDPSRYTSPLEGGEFRLNLEVMAVNLMAKRCLPVLLTPVARRKFMEPDEDGIRKIENTHRLYPEAVLQTARRIGVPSIDLTRLTSEYFEDVEHIAEGASRRFFMNFGAGLYANYPEGKADDSHLRPDGAFEVSRIAAMEIADLGERWPDYAELSNSVIGKVEAEADGEEIDDEFLAFQKG